MAEAAWRGTANIVESSLAARMVGGRPLASAAS